MIAILMDIQAQDPLINKGEFGKWKLNIEKQRCWTLRVPKIVSKIP